MEELCEALELRFLANPRRPAPFALLTDSASPAEHEPDDGLIVELAAVRIGELNARYAKDDEDTFFLLHRPRRWNPRERCWMGHERKRGKLSDLNALIRDGATGPFSLIVGRIEPLARVRYVITLDGSRSPASGPETPGMAQPPRPRSDATAARARDTASARQGRCEPAATTVPLRRLSAAIRASTVPRAVSECIRTLHEGSYIGKGLYEVDGFSRALRGPLPRPHPTTTSEGCYTRGAAARRDVRRGIPPSTDRRGRRHRWIRGDWQLIGWLFSRVPGPGGRRRNPLSSLHRWKLFDNLRRSLLPVAATVLLLMAWSLLAPSWLWTLGVLGVLMMPGAIAALLELFHTTEDMSLWQHFATASRAGGAHLARATFSVATLPYNVSHADAIVPNIGRS